MKRVDLTVEEMIQACAIGCRRQINAIEKGLHHRPGTDWREEWRIHIEGAAGELACAKALGLTWQPDWQRFTASGGDGIGNVEVRTRLEHGRDLWIRAMDANDRPYVLVTGQMPTFMVVGWMTAGEAKSHPEWRKDNCGRDPAYIVPANVLHPLSELAVGDAA